MNWWIYGCECANVLAILLRYSLLVVPKYFGGEGETIENLENYSISVHINKVSSTIFKCINMISGGENLMRERESPRADLPDYDIFIGEFELCSRYYVPFFGLISKGKVWTLYPPRNVLNGTTRKKTRWELLKNATGYVEYILDASPHETIAIRPLTSHHKKYTSKTNKICRTLLEKQVQTQKWRSSMYPCTGTS